MNNKHTYPTHPAPAGWSYAEQINMDGYSVLAKMGRYDVEFTAPLLWDSQEFREAHGCEPTPGNLEAAFAQHSERLANAIYDEARAEAVGD